MTASVSSDASESFALGRVFKNFRTSSCSSVRVAICQPPAISRICRPLSRDSYSFCSSTTAASIESRSSSRTSARSFDVMGSSATKIRASTTATSSAMPRVDFSVSCSISNCLEDDIAECFLLRQLHALGPDDLEHGDECRDKLASRLHLFEEHQHAELFLLENAPPESLDHVRE